MERQTDRQRVVEIEGHLVNATSSKKLTLSLCHKFISRTNCEERFIKKEKIIWHFMVRMNDDNKNEIWWCRAYRWGLPPSQWTIQKQEKQLPESNVHDYDDDGDNYGDDHDITNIMMMMKSDLNTTKSYDMSGSGIFECVEGGWVDLPCLLAGDINWGWLWSHNNSDGGDGDEPTW